MSIDNRNKKDGVINISCELTDQVSFKEKKVMVQ